MDEYLQTQLQTLQLFFDCVRVVNPITNQVLLQQEAEEFVTPQENIACYDVWGCTRACENCISMQALRTKKTVEKFEYIDREIFLIMACVIENQDHEYVIEALRNVTNSSLIEKVEHRTRQEIQAEIDSLNHRLIRDEMTGCYTRTYLDNRLPAMIAQQKQPIVVSFFDLDDFKLINDQYGHQVGDLLLAAIGRNLRKQLLSEAIWMARVGGDEFVFVIEGESPANAAKVLEQAKTIIQKTQVMATATNYVHVHVSYGYTVVEPADTAQSVLERADQAMYQQKRNKN